MKKTDTSSKHKIQKLLESTRKDEWKVLDKEIGDLFRVHNPKKALTVWCKKVRKEGDWEYWCYINQGRKIKYVDADSARQWANEKMQKIGGQQLIKIEARVSNEVKTNFEELSELISSVIKFMKQWGIGVKAKTFDEENEDKNYRKVIQKSLETDKTSTTEISSELKKNTQKYRDGKPNIPTWKIDRVARTEASAIRTIKQLLEFKSDGFKFVEHVARLTPTTGDMDKDFNGSVFEIDFLLKNDKFRIPLHPNCRCRYVLSRGPINFGKSKKWIK